MNENLYKLKQDFLDYWTLDKLEIMTLEQYTDTNRENSFCYWLEHITRDLGSIVGGSSYKFGIYKMGATSKTESATNRTNDGEYAWHTKYGIERESAFESLKKAIIKIAKSAQNNSLEIIDEIDLGHAYKWKIAFLYGNFNCVNMFKLDALHIIASNLNIKYTNKTPISFFHKTILKLKPAEEDYFTFCHALWQQYQERLIDVKKDFSKWLNKNTFESYRAYLGYNEKSIEDRLIEINSFFDEVDFFLVDPKKINGLISTILFLLNKKERSKNQDFEAYDSKNSNGIPKAILGKNNYIKFLKEKFEYQTPNYWIFQGNPTIYDIESALKQDHLKSWKVAAHRDKIKIGDQVILWQTGANAGCYALAEVTSEVSVLEEEKVEKQYYKNLNDSVPTERVTIRILKNLVDDPILKSDIDDDPVFSEFKGGNQGTNFSASQEEFETLLNWDQLNDGNSFSKTRDKIEPAIFNEYISFLRSVVKKIGLKRNDPRVVYSVRGYSLNFIVGQKYCINVYSSKNKENFGVISTERISENSGEYAGKSPQTYYNYINKLELKSEERETVIDAIKGLLDKTTKSGYSKSNNSEFEDFLFGIESSNKKEITMQDPKNLILYGPPGTGKTFYLKEQLFDKYTLKKDAISKEKYFEEVVADITWWQAITLALIEEGRSKVSDILKNRWVATKANLSESKNVRATIWGTLQMHTIEESTSVNYKQRQTPLIFDKEKDKSWILLDTELKEQSPEIFKILEDVNNFQANKDKSIKHYDLVTFHQSFAYEDFIEGIKPIIPENEEETSDLGYKIEDGVFKKLCLRAKNDPENRYAIFIDEINRGNVSAIFGELITLIETDKRLGAKNELSIKLPYSKKEFNVPSNLDIYGTMNTADRSVEALDTALRRRFEFKEMIPDYNVIKNEQVEGIEISKVLETINQRVELLIDRDHTIGHSYFVNVNTKEKLANAFNNKIVPLLQEYFYGDYGKIGLVLGKGFVEKQGNEKIDFADFKYENANDFKTPSFVLKKVDKDSVIEAVENLLGTKKSKEAE